MRLRKIEKSILASLLVAALIVPAGIYGKNVQATDTEEAELLETEIPLAKNEDGTDHEHSFELARDSEDTNLSSYEEDNGSHWVKLFSTFDGVKNIFDHEELPDGTTKLKVVFEITDYDLDTAYPLTWATGIGGGWTSGKPTGVTIDQDGIYEAVLDFESETDGLGKTIGAGDINAASLQLVFRLAEGGTENIANVKKTKVTFQSCYAYTKPVVVTPAPTQSAVTPVPAPSAVSDPTGTPDTKATQNPTGTPGNTSTIVPTNTPKADQQVGGDASKENKVTKLKPAKKTVTIKKGKSKVVKFNVTATDKTKKTTDKITKVQLSNKKVVKVGKKSLGKKKCTIRLKGLKQGKTTLTLQIGKKKAKIKIKVV